MKIKPDNRATEYSNVCDKITDKHRLLILPGYNTVDWICSNEPGYVAKMEYLRMASVEDNYALREWKSECRDACVGGSRFTGGRAGGILRLTRWRGWETEQ